MRLILSVVLSVVTLAVSGQAQSKPAPEIEKLLSGFVEAFHAKDFAKLAQFYAEDGVWMRPNAPMVTGRKNLEAEFKKQFEGMSGVLKLTASEIATSGDQAFAAGPYTFTIPSGSSLTLSGVGGSGSQTYNSKFLTVFKRIKGEWKIAYDMQNADQPPKP